MQGSGFKVFVTIALLALALWELYPTFQFYLENKNIEQMEEEERELYLEANADRLQRLREESLSLGLDLQGGMHVTLELRMDAFIRALADEHEIDDDFEEALRRTRDRVEGTGLDYIDTFISTFQEIDPNVRLSRYFRSAGDNITRQSSNSDVSSFLHREANEASIRAVSIVRERVDRFGVTEPSIQRQDSRRVVVEMPGIDEPERIRELLRGTARLEFRMMADPGELASARNRIFAYFQGFDLQRLEAADVDTLDIEVDVDALMEEVLAEADETVASDTTDVGEVQPEPQASQNPLAEVVAPIPGESVIFGAVAERDTARANALLRLPEVRAMLPAGIELMYTAKTQPVFETGPAMYYLLGVRGGTPELTGEVITDARPDFDQRTNQPQVSISMNTEGAQIWSRLTGANVGRPVAIVLDNLVYSWPNIIDRIPSGQTSITGVSRSEAEDIVVILKSGALPAPMDIIEEGQVGPSLGAASVRAGSISIVVGLLIVALFMVFYYRTAGMIANLALLMNVILIFGILAGFGATLTMPGIAGIVLTIGMAIDANVLIFERIREELSAGRTLKAAIDAGYAKALSAIIDANVTTLFVGIILYSFGIGPIKGFAVTLMAGILASLFTALIVTRLIFDYLVAEKKQFVSLG